MPPRAIPDAFEITRYAAFDEAGDGNVLWRSLNGHEAGNGGHSQGNAYGGAPFLDPTDEGT